MMLPHDEDLERAALACYLLHPKWLADGRLELEDFHLERHRVIYAAMLRIADIEGYAEVDLRTLESDLRLHDELETSGGLAYMSSLDLALPDVSHLPSYARRLRRLTAKRLILGECLAVVDGLYAGFDGVEGREAARHAAERLEGLLQRLSHRLEQRPPVRLDQAADRVLEEAMAAAQSGDTLVGLRTGIAEWDARSLGLGADQVIVLAATTGGGKSTLALQVAAHAALREHVAAGIISIEMPEDQLAHRVLAAESDVPLSAIKSGSLSRVQWQRLQETRQHLDGAPLYLRYCPEGRLPLITTQARAWKAEYGLGLLVIDYLQLMTLKGRWGTRNLEIAAMSRALKELAGELELPILVLSQLSREHIRSGREPETHDLRDSGAIAQDADRVLFIHPKPTDDDTPPQDEKPRPVRLLIRKDRHGPGRYEVELDFAANLARFDDSTFDEAPF